MLTLLLIVVLVLGVVVYKIISILNDPLADIPGPFAARFTRLWELNQVRKDRFEEVNIELHQKYGPVVRLAPGRYSVNDLTASRLIFAHASKFTKSNFYYPFGSPDGDSANLFNELHNHIHAKKRREVAGLFSLTTLLSYEPFVDNQNAVLCSKLREFAAKDMPVDVPRWMQMYAFDVIGEITIGEPFGFMASGTDNTGILQAIHDGNVYGSRIGLLGELHYYLGLLTKTLKLRIPFDSVLDFINERILLREQGAQTSPRADFLTRLLQMKASGKIDDVGVINTIGANVAAGSDTTAISLSALICFLHDNPPCLHRLRNEIDEFTARGALSDPIRYEESRSMPYLQAVIKETLRLWPAVGQPLARIVPKGGAEIAGRHMPAGSVVGVNPWVIHYNKDIFGQDADVFRPERWLGTAEEVSRLDAAFLAFGMGARTCIGKNISLLEMCKVVPQMYRQFDFIADGQHTRSKKTAWFVKPEFSMRVRVREP